MSELKPCPFCGGKVKIQYFEIDAPITFTDCGYEIICKPCSIRFKESLSRMPQFDEKADKAKQKLIERWNRRVSDPTIKPKTGEWIFEECFDEYYGRAYKCSLCGVGVVGKHHNYCPNCGAKMKGESDDNDGKNM